MTPDTIPQSVLFPDLFDKPLVATFNQEHASSDGGAVLLKAAERVYGLVKAFARCLADKRAPGKIRHTLADLIGQRVFGIACGHPDGNDADHLADDPIHKLLLGRDPVSGAPLASQPTISRFENGARRTVLYRMGRELAACVIERHRRRLQGRARRITIDLDPTDDLTHGAQQLTFFNGHYGGWCYLPLLGFLSFDREAEQYLCAAVLRPGKAVAADGTLGLLCRLLPLLRAAFPRARFLVRLDGGFATPEIFDFLDAEPRLDYVVAMAKNAVLQRHAESAMQVARAQSEVGGETAHVYTDTRYAARTWDHERRVVIKAEVVRLGDREPRDNPRFVVTNLRQTPRFIYEKVYCARGDIENRIKELLDGLQIDRTSCCLFSANQLRVFLTAAAYVLMQELRLRAARTACARTQVTWLRDRLLKLGVHVVRSVRRVVLHLPRSTPHLEAWRHIALALGARRIAHLSRRAHLLPGRHRPLRRRGCRCPTLASVIPPRSAAQPRLRLQAAMSETHSCADHALSVVESGPSRIMQASPAPAPFTDRPAHLGTAPRRGGTGACASPAEEAPAHAVRQQIDHAARHVDRRHSARPGRRRGQQDNDDAEVAPDHPVVELVVRERPRDRRREQPQASAHARRRRKAKSSRTTGFSFIVVPPTRTSAAHPCDDIGTTGQVPRESDVSPRRTTAAPPRTRSLERVGIESRTCESRCPRSPTPESPATVASPRRSELARRTRGSRRGCRRRSGSAPR